MGILKPGAMLFAPISRFGRVDFEPRNANAHKAADLLAKTHLNDRELELLAKLGHSIKLDENAALAVYGRLEGDWLKG